MAGFGAGLAVEEKSELMLAVFYRESLHLICQAKFYVDCRSPKIVFKMFPTSYIQRLLLFFTLLLFISEPGSKTKRLEVKVVVAHSQR